MSDEQLYERLFVIAPVAGALLLGGAIVASLLSGGDSPSAVPARSFEASQTLSLVMLETENCGWCKRFDRDVAPIYAASRYAHQSPLRRIHLRDQDTAGIRFATRVTSVPTFVLVDREGREIDRIRGYPGGPERFFPALDRLIDKAERGHRARSAS